MNQIIIIGNGFDLAHGLRTKYADFVIWYFNQAITIFKQDKSYEDSLIKISLKQFWKFNNNESYNNLNDILKFLKDDFIELKYKSPFFNHIINRSIEFNWVDIEIEYYRMVISIYEEFKVSNTKKREYSSLKINLKNLNGHFEVIKRYLEEYLSTINISEEILNQEIKNHFKSLKFESGSSAYFTLFLNFNYTSTVDLYFKSYEIGGNRKKIDIHGSINNPSNPIIFGYGDLLDPNYQELENINEKEALTNIKYFSYFKTLNHSKLKTYLASGEFKVSIMGHSCGLSDRLLLNEIFEHENCMQIKIFYHQINENETDYFDKLIEISRHFRDKYKMSSKILSFEQCEPLNAIRLPRKLTVVST